jgi:hypothetical protein
MTTDMIEDGFDDVGQDSQSISGRHCGLRPATDGSLPSPSRCAHARHAQGAQGWALSAVAVLSCAQEVFIAWRDGERWCAD